MLDTKLLRTFYPREGHAEFYKKRHIKENVSFTIGAPLSKAAAQRPPAPELPPPARIGLAPDE